MASKRDRGRPRYDDILTPAEWRIVHAVRHGLTSRTIATGRKISVDAVKFHVANVLQKLGLDSRAELRLWTGRTPTPLLQAKDALMSEPAIGPIGQISRTVSDIAAATRWYAEVLGLRHLYTFGELSFFDCDGVRLFLSKADRSVQEESIIYFRVGDIGASYDALVARGADVRNAPHLVHRHPDGTEEWMAFVNDNEGRPLGLMAQVRT